MKIAKQKPDAFRTAVYVTENCYELFYSEPKSLGKINKQGQYWYTADGMRFLNNRDALDYLVRLSASGIAHAAPAADRAIVVQTEAPAKPKGPEAPAVLPYPRRSESRPTSHKLKKKAAAKAEPKAPSLEDIYNMLGRMVAPQRKEEAAKSKE